MSIRLNHCYRTPLGTVAGSLMVMMIGVGPVVFVAFSLFMPAIADDFGWSRSSLSLGLLIYTVLNAITIPLLGRVVDHYGIRTPITIAICGFSLVLLAASAMPQSKPVFYIIYGLLGVFGCSLTPMPYAKAVSAVFDRHRGVALGISMAGYGIGAALVSILVAMLITNIGWRQAYQILAITVFVVSMIALWILIMDPMSLPKQLSQPSDAGLSSHAALTGSKTFILIAIALLLISIAINGVISHFVSLANDRGLSTLSGGYLLTALGVASIMGRLITGFLIDRFFAPTVSALIFILPLLGIILLAIHSPEQYMLITAITLGFGLGAEVDVMGYLVGRYFGISSYAEIYGYLLAIFSLGAGAGAYFFGVTYDLTQTYDIALWCSAIGIFLASVLLIQLGPYLYPIHSIETQ